MLTYDMSDTTKPLYQHLYECVKNDILSGKLRINEKMPSKRTLADNLGISTITVENAYDQLMSEGYMYSVPKKGYFISDISEMQRVPQQVSRVLNIDKGRKNSDVVFDFSSNKTGRDDFPFSIWANSCVKH